MPWDSNCVAPSWLPQDGGSASDGKLPASSQSGAAALGNCVPQDGGSASDGKLPASSSSGAAALGNCDRPEEEAVCQGYPDLPCDEELQEMMEDSFDFA